MKAIFSQNFMKTFILIIVSFVILVILLYAVFGSQVSVDKERLATECLGLVKEAQEASQGKICTQAIRVLKCPSDELFIDEAPNGCEISFLEEKGWR